VVPHKPDEAFPFDVVHEIIGSTDENNGISSAFENCLVFIPESLSGIALTPHHVRIVTCYTTGQQIPSPLDMETMFAVFLIVHYLGVNNILVETIVTDFTALVNATANQEELARTLNVKCKMTQEEQTRVAKSVGWFHDVSTVSDDFPEIAAQESERIHDGSSILDLPEDCLQAMMAHVSCATATRLVQVSTDLFNASRVAHSHKNVHTLFLDCSGSMNHKGRMRRMKEAVNAYTDRFSGARFRVILVTSNNNKSRAPSEQDIDITVPFQDVPVTRLFTHQETSVFVNNVVHGGGTPLFTTMNRFLREISMMPGGIDCVGTLVTFSDGKSNEDYDALDSMCQMAGLQLKDVEGIADEREMHSLAVRSLFLLGFIVSHILPNPIFFGIGDKFSAESMLGLDVVVLPDHASIDTTNEIVMEVVRVIRDPRSRPVRAAKTRVATAINTATVRKHAKEAAQRRKDVFESVVAYLTNRTHGALNEKMVQNVMVSAGQCHEHQSDNMFLQLRYGVATKEGKINMFTTGKFPVIYTASKNIVAMDLYRAMVAYVVRKYENTPSAFMNEIVAHSIRELFPAGLTVSQRTAVKDFAVQQSPAVFQSLQTPFGAAPHTFPLCPIDLEAPESQNFCDAIDAFANKLKDIRVKELEELNKKNALKKNGKVHSLDIEVVKVSGHLRVLRSVLKQAVQDCAPELAAFHGLNGTKVYMCNGEVKPLPADAVITNLQSPPVVNRQSKRSTPEPEAAAVAPEAAAVAPEAIAVAPEAIAVAPEAIAVAPEAIAVAPEAIAVAPEAIAVAPEAIAVAAPMEVVEETSDASNKRPKKDSAPETHEVATTPATSLVVAPVVAPASVTSKTPDHIREARLRRFSLPEPTTEERQSAVDGIATASPEQIRAILKMLGREDNHVVQK
jgi:hypothetical protein